MTLTDPRSYASPEAMWMKHFVRRRAQELGPLVTEEVLAELAADPKGQISDQSDALAQVMNFVRTETPMVGRAFVFVEASGESYRLAWMRGTSGPDLDGPTFATEGEAIVAVVSDRLGALGIRHGVGGEQ